MIILMETMRDTVYKNFKRMLEATPISAAEIARATKVHESTVSRWKKGEIVPGIENLDNLAKIFGVDVMEFYKREGNVATISPRTALRKYLVIPDDIIEELCHFNEDSGVWEAIKEVIEIEKAANPHGKQG